MGELFRNTRVKVLYWPRILHSKSRYHPGQKGGRVSICSRCVCWNSSQTKGGQTYARARSAKGPAAAPAAGRKLPEAHALRKTKSTLTNLGSRKGPQVVPERENYRGLLNFPLTGGDHSLRKQPLLRFGASNNSCRGRTISADYRFNPAAAALKTSQTGSQARSPGPKKDRTFQSFNSLIRIFRNSTRSPCPAKPIRPVSRRSPVGCCPWIAFSPADLHRHRR